MLEEEFFERSKISKILKSHFYFLLGACQHIKLRKNLMNRFWECFLDFCVIGPLSNACHQVQFQRDLMERFGKPLKSVD